jgi:Fur family ferric uptake transcriptional regulator
MSLPSLLNTVRSHGMRVSTARRAVLEALLAAGEPLTAEEVAGGADLASTYRNLEALESIGIVRHVHLGHGPGRYELAGRTGGWTTCEVCGESTPLPSPALHAIRLAAREAAGFEPSFSHFALVGRCRTCRDRR